MLGMNKSKAIDLLGGTVSSAAKELGVSYQAVDKWPEVLPMRIADRVLGAYARKALPHLLDADPLKVDHAPTEQAELFAQGNGEGAAGHAPSVPGPAAAVDNRAGVAR